MMKKFLGCCSLLFLTSCLNEQRVDPATPSTFVRYINGGIHDTAKAFEKTSDGGFIILANTSEQPLTTPVTQNTIRIKLVKVNAYGSVEWSAVLPTSPIDSLNYVGNGITLSSSGYIVSGEVIQKSGANSGQSAFLINQIILDPEDGSIQTSNSFSIDFPDATGDDISVSGQAAAELGANRLLVLGSVTGLDKNMILAEITPPGTPSEAPTVNWDAVHGSAPATLLNRMFLDANNNVIFGGTITRTNNLTDLRLVKAGQNSTSSFYDLPFGEPDLSEQANGICRTANGFAMVGSSNVPNESDRDILFTRFSDAGTLLFSKTYPVYFPGTTVDVNLDEEGNGVSTTADGGFIIVATITSATVTTANEVFTIGRGDKDYYLIKANAFGDIEWAHAFGSKRNDIGVGVLQGDDGGYVVLGTTVLANVATIALIKTNEIGKVD